mgnify:CR=1 FL=1
MRREAPDPTEFAGVIAAVRRDGSALWARAALPGDFVGWRRQIRAAAREAGLRISVRRVQDVVFIEHLDHVVTEDQYAAFGKRIQAELDGQSITWDRALHDAARDRLRLVKDELPDGA